MNELQDGLYTKYVIRRMDGRDAPGEKHENCTYYVLDLTHDTHAIPAIRAYADSCREENPKLALDLEMLAAEHVEG